MVFHPKTEETMKEFDDARREFVAENDLLQPRVEAVKREVPVFSLFLPCAAVRVAASEL